MTTLELVIAFSSFVGAAAFFASGYAFRLYRGEEGGDQAKAKEASEEAERLRGELEDRNKRLSSVQRKLADARRTRAKLEDTIEELQKEQAAERTIYEVDGGAPSEKAPETGAVEEELEKIRGEREKLEEELAEIKSQLASVQAERPTTAPEASLTKELAALSEENAQLKAELERLRGEASGQARDEEAAPAERERLADLESEVVTLRAEAAKSSAHARKVGELEEDVRRLRSALQEREGLAEQLAEARSELGALGRELTETKNRADQAQHVLDAIEADARELRTARAEIGALRSRAQKESSRVDDLERLKKENVSLKGEVAELRRLNEAMSRPWAGGGGEATFGEDGDEARSRRVKALERAVAERANLRSRVEELSRRAGETEPSPDGEKGDALTDIDQLLLKLGADVDLHAAVVADDMGLLVGGVGETSHQEDVAALSGLAVHLAGRARDLLSLGKVEQVQLQDTDAMVLYCRLFETAEQSFSLSTLTKTSPPTQEAVDAQVAALRVALG